MFGHRILPSEHFAVQGVQQTVPQNYLLESCCLRSYFLNEFVLKHITQGFNEEKKMSCRFIDDFPFIMRYVNLMHVNLADLGTV